MTDFFLPLFSVPGTLNAAQCSITTTILEETLAIESAGSWNCFYELPNNDSFYRAMHHSAKRGIEIPCRLSVCLSVTLVVKTTLVGNLGNQLHR